MKEVSLVDVTTEGSALGVVVTTRVLMFLTLFLAL